MRAILGVLGLLVALGVVAVVAKKQLTAQQQTIPASAVSVPQQSQHIQQQYKQAIDSALQQSRPMPDEQ